MFTVYNHGRKQQMITYRAVASSLAATACAFSCHLAWRIAALHGYTCSTIMYIEYKRISSLY